MANCMLLSAELQTHQLLLCAWITQKDLQETLCFRKFCDFPCTLCPQPWDFCAPPRHSMQSMGWPLVILKIGKLKIYRGAVGRGWERFWEMFTSVGCVVGLWSTTHTSGGDRSCKWSKHPTEVCLHAEMQRVCTCYTTEITIHCYTAKITLCLLVRDSYVTAPCVSTGWLRVTITKRKNPCSVTVTCRRSFMRPGNYLFEVEFHLSVE